MPRHSRVIIIGSGPAGYTAAIYAARALLKPLLFTGLQQGGQLTITTEVENYPGFAEPIQGPWLVEQMANQAKNVGAEIIFDMVKRVDLQQRPFQLTTDAGLCYTADALIIATGAQARWLGLESEVTFLGGGVSACATCDGFFYRGKDVIVVGGGNTAVEEALYLSHLAKSVTIIHRRDQFRAERLLQRRLFEQNNVEVMWHHVVEEIVGTEAKPPIGPTVTGARLRNLQTNEQTIVNAEGVFIAIGHSPAVEIFQGQLRQKDGGYIWTKPDSTATSVDGVFAAGDVTDTQFRQAITAAGRGCMAALEVEKYLEINGNGAI